MSTNGNGEAVSLLNVIAGPLRLNLHQPVALQGAHSGGASTAPSTPRASRRALVPPDLQN
jgi:hypothetical protein